jgi:membrane protein
MDDRTTGRRQRTSLDGWTVVAAIGGLLAVTFLIERITPINQSGPPRPAKDLPLQSETPRDAYPAGLAVEGGDRGRQAASPAEIPAKGWKDILRRVYSNIGDHRILALAAGTTYYSILSIFPAMAALVAIYGIFTDPDSIAKHLNDIAGFVPGGAIDVAREQLTRVSTQGYRALGLTFIVGLAISLWGANAAMKALLTR